MTPSSEKLLKDTKKVIDDALATLLRDSEPADTYEMLDKLYDHLGDVQDRIDGHKDAIDDEELEEEDEE